MRVFSSPIPLFRQYAWPGSCKRAFRRAFFSMRCGIRVHNHRTISRSCLLEGLNPSIFPFSTHQPLPTLSMPPVGSQTKHIFPSCSPQVSTAASLSARRPLAVDVSQGTLQSHNSAPNRADSVRTFVYTGLLSVSDPIQGFK